jgi:serine/threonine-protein kinase
MPLVSGSRLGSYEIVAPLGEGGMGQVYRARDTKLHREVALKILPEAVASDPDRLMRFEREAKTLASLNHPHIAQIFGLEEGLVLAAPAAGKDPARPVRALVMELVEGEDLAERIVHGPIALDEALSIARQIADALEAAHDAGIIHRDLKPANIRVRPDGTAKVLDFGLAKAREPGGAGATRANVLDSPTITSPAVTMHGVILGTAAYMSPEQARGRAVDKRADIWAFGAVLYEMLTGTRAFGGDDLTDTLTSVLRDTPNWSALPVDTPATVRRVLARCLERDPKRRLRDIGDARVDLEDLAVEHQESTVAVVSSSGDAWWRRGVWLAFGAIVASLALLASQQTRLRQTDDASSSRARLTLAPSANAPLLLDSTSPDVAISSNGQRVIYHARRLDPDGVRINAGQLVSRNLDAFDTTTLVNLGLNPRHPFMSPDGAWIGFETTMGATVAPVLAKVPASGESMVVVCDLGGFGTLRGASWGSDGRITFATSQRTRGLLEVSAAGGTPKELTTPDRAQGERDHLWPEVLPDAAGTLFTIARDDGTLDVAVLPAGETAWRVLVRGGSYAHYVPSGHLLYAVRGVVYGVGFELRSLAVTTEPVALVDGVVSKESGAADYALAANGTLTYVFGTMPQNLQRLVWLHADGTIAPLPLEAGAYRRPRLSPDGSRIAVGLGEGETSSIWLYDIARDSFIRLSAREESVTDAVWSPDGRRLAFWSETEKGIYSVAVDGSNRSERLVHSETGTLYPAAWSSKGDTIAFIQELPSLDLMAVSGTAPHAIRPLAGGAGAQVEASFSPDGRWIALVSFNGDAPEVIVGPADGQRRWPVASRGRFPTWNANGREVLFLEGEAIHRIAIDPGTGLPVGRVTKVLDLPPSIAALRPLEQTPDGRRFLMLQRVDSDSRPPEVRVVLNWVEDLRARMANAARVSAP